MTDLSFTFLSVRMFAAGTLLRTGVEPEDFTPVEELSAGETIYDPVSGRFHHILEMTFGTHDREKARDRTMEVYRLAPGMAHVEPLTAQTPPSLSGISGGHPASSGLCENHDTAAPRHP